MLIGSILLLFVSELFAQPLKVAIAGLSHGHVNGVMRQYKNGEVIILGIAEADEQLVQRYKKAFELPDALFF